MKKETRLSIQWFYDLLEQGECDILDFKEQLGDKLSFGKSIKNFAPNYEEEVLFLLVLLIVQKK